MNCPASSVSRLFAAMLALTLLSVPEARAIDLFDTSYLRGTLVPAGYARWDGLVFGINVSYSNFNGDFSEAASSVGSTMTMPNTSARGNAYGGFIGYNFQWDDLVIGIDAGYNHPSTLETSTVGTSGNVTGTSSLRLVDYWTVRGRAGYAFRQFLPYAMVGMSFGRLNYQTGLSSGAFNSSDRALAAGVVAGVGMDVVLLPNVFLRGEWEFVAFSPVGGIRSNLQTGRVGIGLRF